MDNKEAIERVKWAKFRIDTDTYSPETLEALDMAIKSLERDRDSYDIGYAEGHADGVLQGEKLYAPKLGEWVEQRDSFGNVQLYCNQCGAKAQVGFISFCGKCGAKMKQG